MTGKSCSPRMVIISLLWTVVSFVVLTVGALQFHQVTSLRWGKDLSRMSQKGGMLSSKLSPVQMRDGNEAPPTVRAQSAGSPTVAYTEKNDGLGDMNWPGLIFGIAVAFMLCFGSGAIHMPRNSYNFNPMAHVAHHSYHSGTSKNFEMPETQMKNFSTSVKNTVKANVSFVGHASDRIKTLGNKMQLFGVAKPVHKPIVSWNIMPKSRMPTVGINDKSTKLVIGSAAGVAIGMAMSSSMPSISARSLGGFVGLPGQPKPPGLKQLVIGMEYDSKDKHGNWWRCTIKSRNPNGSFLGELLDDRKTPVVWDEVWPINCRIACALFPATHQITEDRTKMFPEMVHEAPNVLVPEYANGRSMTMADIDADFPDATVRQEQEIKLKWEQYDRENKGKPLNLRELLS